MDFARKISIGVAMAFIFGLSATLFRYEPLPGSHIGNALVWDRWRAQICIVVGETKSCASEMLLAGYSESTRIERLLTSGLPQTDVAIAVSRVSRMLRTGGYSEQEIHKYLYEEIVTTKER